MGFEQIKKGFKKLFPSGDIEERLEALYEKLASEEDVANLKDHRGWVRVAEILSGVAGQVEGEIVRLSDDPTGNSDKIRLLRANRDAIHRLLSIVDRSARNVKFLNENIEKKLQIIEEAANLGQPLRGENV